MRKRGSVYRHGNQWWLQVRYRGRTYRKPAEATTKRAASTELDAYVLAVTGGRVDADAITWTVAQLLDNLERHLKNKGIKSLAFIQSHGRTLREAMGTERAARITATRIDRHIAARLADKKAPATINRDLQVLRAAFRLAVKQRLLVDAPVFTLLREDNARQGFFEAAEVEAVAVKFRDRDATLADVVRFAFESAWRRSEIIGLTWDQVDRRSEEVRLATTKSGKPRLLPITPAIATILDRRWAARVWTDAHDQTHVAKWVFHRKGKRIGDFRKAWRTALEKAGLSTTRLFHDLRRSAVRELVRSGVDQHTAMTLSGHRTAATFRRYNIISTDELQHALALRAAFRAAQMQRGVGDVGAKELQTGYKRTSGGRS